MSSVSESQLSTTILRHHIDWGRGTVTNGGAASVTLRPQALAVLKFLTDRPGAIVTKDELMAAVWPGLAVTDDSLVQCVTEIRKALGDDEHLIIKTVPKRGYVFEPGMPAAEVAKVRWRSPAVAGLAAALAVAGLSFYFWRTGSDVPGFLEMPAIAVLPFNNLGDDAKWDRLADVMTEDVITDLSHSKDFLVIARNSTESYKGKAADVRQIGRDLNVRYVLEGSVQPSGDRIRATAQLIDATTGSHVWSERYDRPASDMFAIEAEITQRIATTLTGYRGVVADAELKIIRRKPPRDMNAFDLYLLGLEAKHELTPESLLKAEALLNRSIALDPNFARAYVGLTWTYAYYISLNVTRDVPATVNKIFAAAGKAVALDLDDGEAHLALGTAYMFRGEPEKAVGETLRAEELAPNNADLLMIAANNWPNLGRPEHAVENAGRALRLNPRYPYWYIQMLCYAYFFGRDFETSFPYCKRVNNPAVSDLAMIAANAAHLARMEEAKALAARIAALDPKWSVEQWLSDQGGFARNEDAEVFVDGARKAGVHACDTSEELKARTDTRTVRSCDAERAKS
jgi:TolB-like protein/DNA-binding winged helix-turn-helix (wHTH) protein